MVMSTPPARDKRSGSERKKAWLYNKGKGSGIGTPEQRERERQRKREYERQCAERERECEREQAKNGAKPDAPPESKANGGKDDQITLPEPPSS